MFEEEKTFQEKPVSEIIMKIGDNWEILLLLWEQVKGVKKRCNCFENAKMGMISHENGPHPTHLTFLLWEITRGP